jgi:hypothetical protein
MGTLKAGVGRADITPPVGIEIGIWTLRKGLSQGVHDRMYARAVVLDDGKTAATVVSLDVVVVSEEMTDRVRAVVQEQTGIPRDNILLNCSHTHTTPYTGRLRPRYGALSAGQMAYRDAFPHVVAGTIVEAWHRRQDAAIGATSMSVRGVTVNRRDPSLPVDPELGVVRIDDEAGEPQACLVNYACHGTAVGAHDLAWTADFPGYLARTVEQAVPGCTCLFLQGAEGDIHPWDWYFGNPAPRFGDTYEAAERLGAAIGGPAVGLLSQIKTREFVEIGAASKVVPLPPRPITWTAEEAETYLAEVEATVPVYDGEVIPDNCPGCLSAQRFPGPYLLGGIRHEARFARQYPESIDVHLTVVRINDLILAANSGELFSELGMTCKRRSPFEHTFVLSCTNGHMGYIPTREAAQAVLDLPLREFVDPVKHRRHYGATITTEVGPGAGEVVLEQTQQLIDATRVSEPQTDTA